MLRFSCLPNKALFVSWPYFHSCRFPNKGNFPPKRLLPPSGEEAVRRSLTDGRGICRAYGQDSQPALSFPSGRSLFNLPRSHPAQRGRPPQCRRHEEATQASGVGKGRAPSPLSRGNYCPHPARTPCPSDRRTGWTCIGEDGDPSERRGEGKGPFPFKPRQLLSSH